MQEESKLNETKSICTFAPDTLRRIHKLFTVITLSKDPLGCANDIFHDQLELKSMLVNQISIDRLQKN